MKGSIVVIIILSTLFFTSCTSKKDKSDSPEKFTVIKPLIKDTVYVNEYVAKVTAFQNVEIRTRVSGIIENIYVDEGQMVQKNQLLFTISSKEYHQDLQRAKAILQNAVAELKSVEIEFENTKKLVEKNIVSTTELEMAKAKVSALNAKVSEALSDENQAKLNLSFAQIKAPFNGIINRIPNKVGSLVEEGVLLTTISNNKEVFAYFNVSERDYLDYVVSLDHEKSKEVTLRLANNTLYPHKGIIETTDSEFDKNTGTIAFRAKFPNPNNILKHGATGKILVNTALKNAMLIPQKSTFDQQENLCVYAIDSVGTVQIKKILPSLRFAKLFVVESGLSPQDKFIYEGLQKVKVGDKITPDLVSFTEIIDL